MISEADRYKLQTVLSEDAYGVPVGDSMKLLLSSRMTACALQAGILALYIGLLLASLVVDYLGV